MEKDTVAQILEQWHRERPDVDTSGGALAGRILRCTTLLRRRADEWLAPTGVTWESFDILAALRRLGAPYQLTPTELYKSLLLTSGTMTNRLDRAEKAGLVRRTRSATDRRVVVVELTDHGKSAIDATFPLYHELTLNLLRVISEDERNELSRLLSVLLGRLEADELSRNSPTS